MPCGCRSRSDIGRSAGVPADETRIPAALAYVAEAQAEPERHVTYIGLGAGTLLEEFAEAEAWTDPLLVALIGDELAGVMLADIDSDMRRVWWLGPCADTEGIATALLLSARDRFGALFDEEELAPDSRNEMLRSSARVHRGDGVHRAVESRSGDERDIVD